MRSIDVVGWRREMLLLVTVGLSCCLAEDVLAQGVGPERAHSVSVVDNVKEHLKAAGDNSAASSLDSRMNKLALALLFDPIAVEQAVQGGIAGLKADLNGEGSEELLRFLAEFAVPSKLLQIEVDQNDKASNDLLDIRKEAQLRRRAEHHVNLINKHGEVAAAEILSYTDSLAERVKSGKMSVDEAFGQIDSMFFSPDELVEMNLRSADGQGVIIIPDNSGEIGNDDSD